MQQGKDVHEYKSQKQVFCSRRYNKAKIATRGRHGDRRSIPHCCALLLLRLISLPRPPSAESDPGASQQPKMYRDAHIQGVQQIASDIAVLIIGFASGMSAITTVKVSR